MSNSWTPEDGSPLHSPSELRAICGRVTWYDLFWSPFEGEGIMQICRRLTIATCVATNVLLLTTAVGRAEIVIDDTPLSTQEILAEVPIVGYRALPKGGLVSLNPKKDQWALDGTVLYDAAEADVDFQKQTGKSKEEIKDLPLDEIIRLYKIAAKSTDNAPCVLSTHKPMMAEDCGALDTTVIVRVGAGSRLWHSKLDPQIVRRAFAAGAFDKAHVSSLPVAGTGGSPAFGVTIDPAFARRATGLYILADKYSNSQQDPGAAFDWGKARMAAQDTPVSRVAAVPLTTVAIGKPLVMTADEKD